MASDNTSEHTANPTFKVGDRVRYVGMGGAKSYSAQHGDIGIIESLSQMGFVVVRGGRGFGWHLCTEELEHITQEVPMAHDDYMEGRTMSARESAKLAYRVQEAMYPKLPAEYPPRPKVLIGPTLTELEEMREDARSLEHFEETRKEWESEEAFQEAADAPTDAVVQPSHYSRFVIEPATFNAANNLPFLTGNVVKYVVRAPYKNGREDLLKARRCVDMLIEAMDREARVAAGESPADVWKVML